MSSPSCPQCGWAPGAAARCPRCGVDVTHYRADLAAVSAVPAPPVEPAPSAPAAPPVAAPTPAGTPRPAGFWMRAGALLIDVVVVMVAEALFGLALWAVTDDRLAYAASRAFRVLASPCYFVLLHWARGQTLGKMVFRVRVVTLAGGPLPFGISVLRHLGSWISAAILGVGYLVAAFRADKRALHDLIAGTRVEHIT